MTKTLIIVCLLIAFTATLSYSEIILMPHNGVAGVWMPMEIYDEYNKVVLYELPTIKEKFRICSKDEDFWKPVTFVATGIIVAETVLLVILWAVK